MTKRIKVMDLLKGRLSGVAVPAEKVEPLLYLAAQVVEAADKAKERGQTVEPTHVRLSIAALRAELRLWSPDGDSTP